MTSRKPFLLLPKQKTSTMAQNLLSGLKICLCISTLHSIWLGSDRQVRRAASKLSKLVIHFALRAGLVREQTVPLRRLLNHWTVKTCANAGESAALRRHPCSKREVFQDYKLDSTLLRSW